MQSIWLGRTENIFSSDEEREVLIEHTKKAMQFARNVGCRNLVFGCPKNRSISSLDQYPIAIEFFTALGEYALTMNTRLAIEPNPTIYNTNFINTTEQAFQLVKYINHPGVRVNIDFGTIIQNKEKLDIIIDNLSLVNHIHISEPFLETIKAREGHKYLAKALKVNNYDKYVSIEMKNNGELSVLKETISYFKGVFA
jgi:sugar phosphate isomerase/epimerase